MSDGGDTRSDRRRAPDPDRDPGSRPGRHRGRRQNAAHVAELEARVAELEALYRATPVAVCVVDRELRYLRVNDAYAAVVAKRPDDIVGRTMNEIVHPRARDIAVGMIRGVIQSGGALRHLELPGVSRTDPPEERVWLLNAHPVKTDDEVSAVIGVMQDVTRLKQAERAARERLDVIDSLFRNAPIGLVYMGEDLRYQRVNEIIAEINGITPEEHVGKRIGDVHPALGPEHEALLRRLMEDGRRIREAQVELQPPTDPDHAHVYRLSCDRLDADDGSPRGLLATVLDVTEQVRIERELKAAHERSAAQLLELETIYEHAPVALCYVDRDLRILRANRILARAHGLPLEDNLGRTLTELNPETAPQFLPAFKRLFETGLRQLDVAVQGRLQARPDREHSWLMHLHPTFDANDRVDGAIVVIQNVTEFQRQQTELAEAKARLEEAQRLANHGSWEWDLESDAVWWSEALFEIMGKQRERFTPSWNAFVDLVHPDDRSRLRAQIEATLERNEPYWLDFRVVLDDMSERTLRSAARLERGDDGRPRRLIGTCQRVGPSEQSPSALRRRSERDPSG